MNILVSEITRTNHNIPCLHKTSFYKLLNILLEKNFIDNSCEDSILICTKLYEQARYTNEVRFTFFSAWIVVKNCIKLLTVFYLLLKVFPVEKYKKFSEKFHHIVNS